MRVTNKENLPQPIVDAVVAAEGLNEGRSGWFDQNHISVTELIDSPRIRYLKAIHWRQMEMDVSDRLFALYGSAMHNILEMADTTSVKEKRLYASVTQDDMTWLVSGKFDRLSLLDGALQDYKTMSVYEHLSNKGYPRPEREQQLNLYAWLCEMEGIKVERLEAYGFMKDWKAGQAVKSDYPKQVQRYEIRKWEKVETYEFLHARLAAHADAKFHMCTAEERWSTEDKWAVVVKGKKRAVPRGVSSDKEYIDNMVADFERKEVDVRVEFRPGRDIRCSDRGDGHTYCDVSSYCPYANSKGELNELIWD